MDVAELERFISRADNDELDCYDGVDPYWAASLARRVIAAEKLADAVRYDLSCWPDTMEGTLRDVLQAYEATK